MEVTAAARAGQGPSSSSSESCTLEKWARQRWPNAAGSGRDAVLGGASRPPPSDGEDSRRSPPGKPPWRPLHHQPHHHLARPCRALPPAKGVAGTRGWFLTLCSEDCVSPGVKPAPHQAKGDGAPSAAPPGKAAAEADCSPVPGLLPISGVVPKGRCSLAPQSSPPCPKRLGWPRTWGHRRCCTALHESPAWGRVSVHGWYPGFHGKARLIRRINKYQKVLC